MIPEKMVERLARAFIFKSGLTYSDFKNWKAMAHPQSMRCAIQMKKWKLLASGRCRET